MPGLVGKKIGMTQVFREDGTVVPVTLIKAGPNFVVYRRTKEKDGYEAVALGFEEAKRANRPMMGIFKKAGLPPLKKIVEFRVDDSSQFEPGQRIDVDILKEGEKVDVTGWEKGRGFQGVVKRHGFAGGPRSHGSKFHRIPGPVGATTDPGRVWKGKKLPGRMGNERVTIKNLEVVKVDREQGIVAVKGGVPGARNSWVIIRKKG
ncbi:50S ribosomal protein L3 [bacterium]|nr:MAG: 50S ribosomal protein L3 [bacterium]